LTQYEIAFDIDLPVDWNGYASLSKLVLIRLDRRPCGRSIEGDDADRRVRINQFDGDGKNSLRLVRAPMGGPRRVTLNRAPISR
jgi:hypothetical protein